MPIILSGLAAREELKKSLIVRAAELERSRGDFALAIIQVGDRADSNSYIRAKQRFGAEVGIPVIVEKLADGVGESELIGKIHAFNADPRIAGIIVQLPLPQGIDRAAVLDAIDPAKDADGITSANVSKWSAANTVEEYRPWPATAYGIFQLLTFYKIPIRDRKVCVVGRSELVGKPIAAILKASGALVTVCHSKTSDLAKETLAADVIISAVGKPGLITAAHVRAGQTVIDVGISRLGPEQGSRLSGDADFIAVSAVLGDAGAITPVPGGVGPMTVLALFENLLDCAKITDTITG